MHVLESPNLYAVNRVSRKRFETKNGDFAALSRDAFAAHLLNPTPLGVWSKRPLNSSINMNSPLITQMSHFAQTLESIKDVDLYNCRSEKLQELQSYFHDLAQKCRIIGHSQELAAEITVDTFALMNQLMKLYTFNNMISEKNDLICNVLPLVLMNYIVNHNSFKRFASQLDATELQSCVYESCQVLDASQAKVGVLSFNLLLQLGVMDSLVLKFFGLSMMYGVVPNLKFCNHLADTLTNSLRGDLTDNEILFKILKDCVSINSRSTRELLSIILRNNAKLISMLDAAKSMPHITSVNKSCISRLLQLTAVSVVSSGMELQVERRQGLCKSDPILHSALDLPSLDGFWTFNPRSLTQSLKLLMDLLEHGDNLIVLESKKQLLFYVFATKRICLESKNNQSSLYWQFNRFNCKISLVTLILSSIYLNSLQVAKHYWSKLFPDFVSSSFDIFRSPPLAKPNYLYDDAIETTQDPHIMTLCLQGQISLWVVVRSHIAKELRTCLDIKSDLDFKLISRFLDLMFAGLFVSAYVFTSDLDGNATSPYESLALNLLKRCLQEVLATEMSFTGSKLHKDDNLVLVKFVTYLTELCEADLQFVQVIEKLFQLIDWLLYIGGTIARELLTDFLLKFDPKGRGFVTLRIVLGTESTQETYESNLSTTTNYSGGTSSPQWLDVSISSFDGFFGQDESHNDDVEPKHDKDSITSTKIFSIQAKRDELFAINSRHDEEYTEGGDKRR
jgi:hypothetical protein